ncbi:MAG: hypothetical protein RL385_4132 [Pseudomonadota bacterium]
MGTAAFTADGGRSARERAVENEAAAEAKHQERQQVQCDQFLCFFYHGCSPSSLTWYRELAAAKQLRPFILVTRSVICPCAFFRGCRRFFFSAYRRSAASISPRWGIIGGRCPARGDLRPRRNWPYSSANSRGEQRRTACELGARRLRSYSGTHLRMVRPCRIALRDTGKPHGPAPAAGPFWAPGGGYVICVSVGGCTPRSDCSSPLFAISRTMSQPPTKVPFT